MADYVIHPGDTLSSIAARFHTTVGALAKLNGLANPNLIFAGRRLQVPDGYSSGGAPPVNLSGGAQHLTGYTVKSGDTVSGLAARFGTTVAAITQANALRDPNRIFVGQHLQIPSRAPSPTPPTTPTGSGASGTRYTVRPGDTLSGIAQHFGSTVAAIAQANGIANPNRIGVGQVLTIPRGGGSTPVDPVHPPIPHPTTGGVSAAQLQAIMPNLSDARAKECLPWLNQAMAEAGITTPGREAAFLAQLAHESGQFRWFEELASGQEYEGRADLGNTHPGDGPRYKGRGPIQLTGRANYRAAGRALGLDLEGHPEQVATPEVGFRVAAWFWTTHGLNRLADEGNFDGITRAINGGTNGKASRDWYYARAKQVLGA